MKKRLEWMVKNKKKIIIMAALICFISFVTLAVFYFYKKQNEFFVPLRTKVLFICVTCGGMLVPWVKDLMNKKLKFFLGGALFLAAPYIIFCFFESIVNDFSTFIPKATWWNCIFIFCLQCLVLGVTRKLWLTFLLTHSGLFVFYVADFFVIRFRKTPILFSDVFSYRTALGVAGNYIFILTYQIMEAFYIMLALLWISFAVGNVKFERKIVRNAFFGILFLIGGIGVYGMTRTDLLTDSGYANMPFIPTRSSFENGLLLDDCINAKEAIIKKPEGYDINLVKDVMNRYEEGTVTDTMKRPNIIVIMNESYTDMDYLETVEVSSDYNGFYRGLKDNAVRGTLISSVLGGNTPNSEFEMLTGCSMAFLPAGTVTFQQTISEELPAIASNLSKLGYNTTALHLYNPEYWNRNRIYPLLGFRDFISLENCDMGKVEFLRDYASDESHFNYLIDLYENKGDAPMFAYCVTVQNHGGFWWGMNDIQVINGSSGYANEYVSLLKITDDEFSDLIQYFEGVSEPTIVCMFGDHQPFLFDDFYDSIWQGTDYTDVEKRYMQAKVPFVIWANYDIDEREVGETSINYLGAMILQEAGVPLSGYDRYLLELQKKVPVISAVGCVDANGNYVTDYRESIYAQEIREYEYLQYYYLNRPGNMKFWELSTD